MAQTTKKRSSGTTRRSTKSKPRTSARSNSARSRNGSSHTSKSMVAELAAKAKPQAEKVKGPLLAGGAALAGLAGAVALKSRTEHRRPIDKLSTRALPKALRNIDLGKLDLDKITEAGRRVRSIGEQVGDVADAAAKTHKKHN